MDMTLQPAYSRAVAAQLGCFAVWQPGSEAALGDYGTLKQGRFERLGNIAEFNIPISATTPTRNFWEFSSKGVASMVSKVKASGKDRALNLSAAASLDISFRTENSLFVRAHACAWEEITKIREMAIAARERPEWDFGWRIISGRRIAQQLVLLMNTTANAKASIQGSLDLINGLQRGQVQLGTEAEVTGEAALKYFGPGGAFLIDLVRVNRWPAIFGQVSHLLPGQADEPYERIDPLSSLDEEPPASAAP
jgi:hypothetical protein